GFDLQPDFILEVTDGTTARTMTVANLAVTGFDLDNDTITGTGVPDQEVQVCVNGPDRCYIRYATSDGDGEWTVDYAHAGPREDEQDTLELQPGSEGWAAETDSNGNRTIVDWRIANPWIEANLTGNWVQARDWPDGAELALTINDPSNGDNVDKTATATVGPAPWNPNETMADFDLEGFDLQPDFILEVTDGTNGTTRTMTTANLGVTGFDISTDTITGVGDADLEVQVCVDLSDNCYSRYATPESTKVWAVDYANPGSREDEQDLTDLRAGSFGWAAQNDPQGNRTRIDWKVPSPYISDIADQTTDEDTATDAIPFVIDDADVSPESLTISAESSDTELVPVENISFEGSGMERTITIQPAPDLYGSATITVTVDNGSEQSPASFELTVNAVNDPPTLTLTNKTTSLPENTSIASAMMVAEIVVTDDDLGTNTLALSGADAALFEIMGSELRLKAGTVLDFETKPVLNVTVEVSDLTLGGTPDDSETLTINITDVNEAPVITEDEPVMVTMSRNGNPQQFSLTLHATDEDQNSTLTWKVSIPAQHGTATVSGTGTSKMISYTPAADYSGTDSFVVEVSDGEGGKDTITVNVTITKINQIFLPTIVK
ncbi:MAG: cadherin-like domain-containing protein, partial [Chloroflexi bacterium]|nr:cadherin-like domain-containing protein [Chloroflexota bacterium]